MVFKQAFFVKSYQKNLELEVGIKALTANTQFCKHLVSGIFCLVYVTNCIIWRRCGVFCLMFVEKKYLGSLKK